MCDLTAKDTGLAYKLFKNKCMVKIKLIMNKKRIKKYKHILIVKKINIIKI